MLVETQEEEDMVGVEEVVLADLEEVAAEGAVVTEAMVVEEATEEVEVVVAKVMKDMVEAVIMVGIPTGSHIVVVVDTVVIITEVEGQDTNLLETGRQSVVYPQRFLTETAA